MDEMMYLTALALVAEIEATIDYYNLIGRAWTGNTIEVPR